jgi:Beta-galactosidase
MKFKEISLLLVFSMIVTSACAKEVQIVKNGRIVHAIQRGGKWHNYSDSVACRGVGNWLVSPYIFKPEKIKVNVRLSVTLNKNASGIRLADSLIGFDGGSREEFFFEGPLFANKNKCKKIPEGILKNEKAFDVEILKNGHEIQVTVNGKLIWKSYIQNSKPVLIALRPHRAVMKVYNFSVNGEIAALVSMDELDERMLSTPVGAAPMPVNQEINFTVPALGLDKVKQCALTLSPINSSESINLKKYKFIKDKKGSITVSIPADVTGKLYKMSPVKFNTRPFICKISSGSLDIAKYRFVLYNPNEKNTLPKVTIKRIGNMPQAVVNGKSDGAVIAGYLANNYNGHRYKSDVIKQFHDAGIKKFHIRVVPWHFARTGKLDVQKLYDYTAKLISQIVTDAPNAYIKIDYLLYMSQEWCKKYPEEMIKMENGARKLRFSPNQSLQPSYASLVWRKEAGEDLKKFLQNFAVSPYADRMISVKLCYANCGEWNHWGYHQKSFVDYSKPMQKAFSSYLEKKYLTVANLRKAWGNNNVSFDQELVPSKEQRLKYQNGMFRTIPQGRPAIDYYQFFQEYTVDTIEHFAKIIRKATEGKTLTGAYYGYYIGHLQGNPYHFQDSGNYALKKYLESPYLDFLGSPYPYSNRRSNCMVNAVASSVALHNKLLIEENDMRTHRSSSVQKTFGKLDSMDQCFSVAVRDFMMSMQFKSSYYLYDFAFGWYRDQELMNCFAKLKKIDTIANKIGRKSKAQIVVFASEKSMPYIGSQKNPALGLLQNNLLFQLNRTGAPWDFFLISDINKVDMKQYKVALFPDSYMLTDQNIKSIKEKVAQEKRTLVFFWAPGLINPDGNIDTARSQSLTGIKIKCAPNGFTEKIKSNPGYYQIFYGPEKKAPFRTWIDDPTAKTTARHTDDKSVAGATKVFPTHIVKLYCFPALNSVWLRYIFKNAGVHIYLKNKFAYLYAAGPFMGVYAPKGGGIHEIKLPSYAPVVYDVFSNKVIARNVKQFKINLPKKLSGVMLYIGKDYGYKLLKEQSTDGVVR